MTEFSRLVAHAFGDLLRRHGFRLALYEPTRLAYESPRCKLVVGQGWHGSNEVSLDLKLRESSDEPGFTLEEILRAASIPAGLHPQGYFAVDEQRVSALLATMASLLSQHGGPLLDGDTAAWSRLESQRVADVAAYANDNELRHALAAASTAWQVQDWASFVGSLDKVKSRLSAADMAKFEYATRRLLRPHQ